MEFVLVVGGDQVVFQVGFAVGDVRHEVVVLGLALLVLGPIGVAEVGGAFQGTPEDGGGRRGQRWRPLGLGGGGTGLSWWEGVRKKRWKSRCTSSSFTASRRASDVRRR